MEFQTPPEPSILTGNKRELRWAVGSANGPRSSIWKVKAHSRAKDGQHTVYVGTKQQMHAVKLSLHEPSIWQFGYDRNYSTKLWPNEIRAPSPTSGLSDIGRDELDPDPTSTLSALALPENSQCNAGGADSPESRQR
jgi:hypothetical protein